MNAETFVKDILAKYPSAKCTMEVDKRECRVTVELNNNSGRIYQMRGYSDQFERCMELVYKDVVVERTGVALS